MSISLIDRDYIFLFLIQTEVRMTQRLKGKNVTANLILYTEPSLPSISLHITDIASAAYRGHTPNHTIIMVGGRKEPRVSLN
jgi:hypothetical protein